MKRSLKKEVEKITPTRKTIRGQLVEKIKLHKQQYIIDLRILNPISQSFMGLDAVESQPALIKLARVKGLDIIGVTDFYHNPQIDNLITLARAEGITLLPGIDLKCRLAACDDLQLTAFFDPANLGCEIDLLCSRLNLPPTVKGNLNFKLPLDIDSILKEIENLGGFAILSRVDQTPLRMSVLKKAILSYGFVTFDLVYPESAAIFSRNWPKNNFNLFSFSNAASLAQVGSRVGKLSLAKPDFENLKTALERKKTTAVTADASEDSARLGR
ncbi:MAG TPA: hypothetical protein PKD37_07875 [Oligoflexia bacterium]|nr:hypothetical protein [Oligoflexia bacterium]HMP27881.1 hypothetical protein [Oligoflexia bacterium]